MNENNHDDFSFFANSKRIKKDEPVITKSPLDAGSKWDIQEEIKISNLETNRAERKFEAAPVKTEPVINKFSSPNEDQIGNVGSELQKFRKYPTKTYDQLINKMVLFNTEEFHLIRDLASEISIARKRSSIPNKGSLPRVTENTVIRAALSAIFSKIGKTNTDLTTLQTEESLENYFNSLLK